MSTRVHWRMRLGSEAGASKVGPHAVSRDELHSYQRRIATRWLAPRKAGVMASPALAPGCRPKQAPDGRGARRLLSRESGSASHVWRPRRKRIFAPRSRRVRMVTPRARVGETGAEPTGRQARPGCRGAGSCLAVLTWHLAWRAGFSHDGHASVNARFARRAGK